MNSESELIKALSELVVTPDPVIEYRMYYDDSGTIVMCMMQGPYPDNDSYVVATKEQYEFYWKYQVVKGKLELIPTTINYRKPFVKSDSGFRVVKNHASLLILDNEQFTETEYYDRRNR